MVAPHPPSRLSGSGSTPDGPYTYQVVHVNAEFANQVSDHDPQVVEIKP